MAYTAAMRSRLRSALMWLLLLALPLQGLAAATMLGCGPMHGRMATGGGAQPLALADAHTQVHGQAHAQASAHTHAQAQAPAQAPAHDHASMQAHDGHSQHMQLAAGQAPDQADEVTAHHMGGLGKFKCSACAACCVAVALPAAELAVAALPPAFTPVLFVKLPHLDFLSATLDRPPRNLAS